MTTAIQNTHRGIKRVVYEYNPLEWDTYTSMHRPHQVLAIMAANANNRGRIISPCGTGKTRIQIHLHVGGMITLFQDNRVGVFVIASPRLLLNRQLCDELVEVLVKCGLPFDILSIGSDIPDTSKYYCSKNDGGYSHRGYSKEVSVHHSTTNSAECERFIAKSLDNKRNVLVVTTYDSIGCLANVSDIALATYDEAHNITRAQFTANISKVSPNIKREYFFTATPNRKDTKDGVGKGGMNDETIFGPELINILSTDMVKCGEIASPRIQCVKGSKGETATVADDTMIAKSILEGFDVHGATVKEESANPDDLGIKMMVAAPNQKSMLSAYKKVLTLCAGRHIQHFAISTDGAYVNGIKVSQSEFRRRLAALKESDDALIYNVDMLGEGINLPSITGVMPLRNLTITKLMQLVGRAMRRLSYDRIRLYKGEVLPGDDKGFTKPHGHIILHEHLLTEASQMQGIIERIYREFGTPVLDLLIHPKYPGITPDELKSMLESDVSHGKDFEFSQIIHDVMSRTIIQIRKDDTRDMSPKEKIAYNLRHIR